MLPNFKFVVIVYKSDVNQYRAKNINEFIRIIKENHNKNERIKIIKLVDKFNGSYFDNKVKKIIKGI